MRRVLWLACAHRVAMSIGSGGQAELRDAAKIDIQLQHRTSMRLTELVSSSITNFGNIEFREYHVSSGKLGPVHGSFFIVESDGNILNLIESGVLNVVPDSRESRLWRFPNRISGRNELRGFSLN